MLVVLSAHFVMGLQGLILQTFMLRRNYATVYCHKYQQGKLLKYVCSGPRPKCISMHCTLYLCCWMLRRNYNTAVCRICIKAVQIS